MNEPKYEDPEFPFCVTENDDGRLLCTGMKLTH